MPVAARNEVWVSSALGIREKYPELSLPQSADHFMTATRL